MPAITAISFATFTPLRRALTLVGRMLARRGRQLRRAVERRRALQALARFDDRMLADIGLNRADVRDAAVRRLWDDPTALLRARVLERRLARHGITHGLSSEIGSAPSIVPKVDQSTLKQARVAFCHYV